MVSGHDNRPVTALADAISISRATVRNIRQSLFGAFIYNVLVIPVAACVRCRWSNGWFVTGYWAAVITSARSITIGVTGISRKGGRLVVSTALIRSTTSIPLVT